MLLQCSVQMERWNYVPLDINATCTELGPKRLQLMGMHILSGCDTVYYPFNKGKISALNTLQAVIFLACTRCWVKRMPHVQTLWKQVKGSSQPCMVSH